MTSAGWAPLSSNPGPAGPLESEGANCPSPFEFGDGSATPVSAKTGATDRGREPSE